MPDRIVWPLNQDSPKGISKMPFLRAGVAPPGNKSASTLSESEEVLTRILWEINTNHANTTTRSGNVNSLCQNQVPNILSLRIYTLITDTIASAVDTLWLTLQDLSDGIAFAEVDGDCTDAFCLSETFRDAVDAVYFAGTSEKGRICCEESYGTWLAVVSMLLLNYMQNSWSNRCDSCRWEA